MLLVRVRVSLRQAVYRQCLSWRQAPWDSWPVILLTEHLPSYSLCNILSEDRMGLSFTIAAGPRQRSHSHVRAPQDSWPHFTVSDTRDPPPGGSGPRIYVLQEQGGPVITPSTGFPFRLLIRLVGLRWGYYKPPPHGVGAICLHFDPLITPRHLPP
jgi:hypothetical protein